MNEIIARILHISVINSGMFDTLSVNTDVSCVHLVGENNVGKTSFIEMIQFLYFSELKDMKFSKTVQDSLQFYFKREGSYMLFTVRTLQGTVRTIGHYGEGDAQSRTYFVFDGDHDLHDFLDDTQKVRDLRQMSAILAHRNLYKFTKFSEYDNALIGKHTTRHANVQLFDVDAGKLRSLRTLLQNLLKLQRLTDNEIRDFFIEEARKQDLVTSIDMATEYNERYNKITDHTKRINELQQLEPIIIQWRTAQRTLDEATQHHSTLQQRLADALTQWHGIIQTTLTQKTIQHHDIVQQIDTCAAQRDTLIRTKIEYEQTLNELTRTQRELTTLETACAGRDVASIDAELDAIRQEIFKRKHTITQSDSVQHINQQLRELTTKRANLVNQRTGHTVLQQYVLPHADAQVRALVQYLLSEDVLALSTSTYIRDTAAVHQFLHDIRQNIDADGTFHGFGMHIPATLLAHATTNELSLDDQIAACDRQLVELQQRLVVANDMAAVHRAIAALEKECTAHEHTRDNAKRRDALLSTTGGNQRLVEQITLVQQKQALLAHELASNTQQRKAYEVQQRELSTDMSELTRKRAEIEVHLHQLSAPSIPCPTDIACMHEAQLSQYIDETRRSHASTQAKITHETQQRDKAQNELQKYHMRSSIATFAEWIDTQHDLSQRIVNLREQLNNEYHDMLLFVQRQLSSLKTTYEHIEQTMAELNGNISAVSISNISNIRLLIKRTTLLDAVTKIVNEMGEKRQLWDTDINDNMQIDEAREHLYQQVTRNLTNHGTHITIESMFSVEFAITFTDGDERTFPSITSFESNGTMIGVKIVLYLGLIRLLLKQTQRHTATRIPFFLDEVGSLSSNNVRSIIVYCTKHHFLPLFASPTIRSDVSHNYVLQRRGKRSVLVNVITSTPRDKESS